jgi:mono/diheme cytochrome c family protein
VRLSFLAAAFVLLEAGAVAQLGNATHVAGSKAGQLAAGKYIVEDVAMCSTCHTPRQPNGQFIKQRMLMGGRLAFTVPPTGRWASEAPQIAGLPRWEDDEIVILLTTGKLETGLAMRPPMPQFHMTEQDARAVVAYLRSLAPPKKTSHARRRFP